MKVIRNVAVAGCSVLLLCQCATKDEVRELNYQIRAVNQKVEEVKTNTVDKMQKRQANSVSKIDQVESELLSLRSTLEENGHQSLQFREQTKENFAGVHAILEEMHANNQQKMLELESKINQLGANIDTIQEARIRTAQDRAAEAARRAEEAKKRTVIAASGSGFVKVSPQQQKIKIGTGKVVEASQEKPAPVQSTPVEKIPSPASPASVETVTVPDTASGPFIQGLNEYKAKKYKEAYALFEQVLATNPKGGKAAETLFYMGESLFQQGEYDLAILDYQKVISNHAQDSHAPNALLKQGMSFEKLTDHETAKIIYKKLIADYAGSPEADEATARLGNL